MQMSGSDRNPVKLKRTPPAAYAAKVAHSKPVDTICEKQASSRDAFWADAMKSASILAWIVAHTSAPQQHPLF